MAESAVTLLLDVIKKVRSASLKVKEGNLNERASFIGYEIKDKIFGIIGIGTFEESVEAINIGTTGMFRIAYSEAIFDKEDSMRLQTYYLSS